MQTNLSEQMIEEIQNVVMKQLGIDRAQVEPDADLKVDLGADSLDMVEIAMTLEEKLSLGGNDDSMEGVQTVGDLYEAVEKRLAALNTEAKQ